MRGAHVGSPPGSPLSGAHARGGARAARGVHPRPARARHERAGHRPGPRGRPHRVAAHGPHRPHHEPRVLRPLVARLRRPRRQPPGLAGRRRAGPRRACRRAHGPLRVRGDPRPRHPRGDGAGALQREPHPGAAHLPQAALGGDLDRHRRPVRRRGADHRHRRRARVARRAGAARDGGRAQDAAGRRRGRRHVRHVRQRRSAPCSSRSSCSSSSTAPRSLVPVALASVDRVRGAHRPGRRRPGVRDARRRRAAAAARSPSTSAWARSSASRRCS